MRSIKIERKKSIRSLLLPYIVDRSKISKEEFCTKYKLIGDRCDHNLRGQPICKIRIDEEIERDGVLINNGETIHIDITEDVVSIFVMTMSGSLSNEIKMNDMKTNSLIIKTKDGFTNVCYPVIEESTH